MLPHMPAFVTAASPLLACGDQWRRAGALLEVFNQQLRPSLGCSRFWPWLAACVVCLELLVMDLRSLPSYTAVLADTWTTLVGKEAIL